MRSVSSRTSTSASEERVEQNLGTAKVVATAAASEAVVAAAKAAAMDAATMEALATV